MNFYHLYYKNHIYRNFSIRIMARLTVIITIFLSFLAPLHSRIYAKDHDLNKAEQLFSKGEFFFTEYNIDLALRYYFAALDSYPFMSKAYYKIGVIYGPLKRRYKKSIRFFRKSIKYDFQNPNAYYGLGLTYCMSGDERLGSKFLLKAGLMFLREGNVAAALTVYDVLNQTKEKDRKEKLTLAIERFSK